MKIVHLVNYIQPKLGYQEYFLAREHARMGHNVTVVTSDRYARFPDYRNTVYPILGNRIVGSGKWQCDGFEIVRLKTRFEIGSKVWLSNLASTMLDLKPEVVICHGMTNLYALKVANLKRKLDYRLIYDDHTLLFVTQKGILRNLFYRCFNFKKIKQQADKIIGIAQECVDVISRKYKIPRENVEMIPLGVDTDLFKFDDELRTDFRKEFSICKDETVITYTGRMTPEKAPHSIITAIDNLGSLLNKKIVLLFVGNIEKDYKDIFESYRKTIGKFARVITLPAVENKELVRIYSASDIGVWPKQATASTIEALSCSLPIICIDTVSERCKNKNGISIRPGNLQDLFDALLKLVNDDELRITMGKRGRELAERELSWAVIAQRFLDE